jgi:hypothetical protein
MNGFFIGFAAALLLWFLAFLYLKSIVRRRTSPDYILGLLQEDIEQDIDQLKAAIDIKTEESLQLLEEKISALREISSEAERRIAVYNRELQKYSNEKETMSVLNKKPLVERIEIKNQTTAEAEPPQNMEKQKQSVPLQAFPVNITKSREPLVFKPRPAKERIAELQKAGFAPELIAKRLGINLGEVQLYFNLADKSE